MRAGRWVFFVIFGSASVAAAEPRIKSLKLVEVHAASKPDQVTSRAKLAAVVGGSVPGLRPQDFTVKVDDGGVPVLIGAEKCVPFSQSDDELALMILVQGTVRFMGGAEGEETIDGYYDVVKQAVDIAAKARPKHTRVGLYVYGDSVIEKVPMGAPENVSGESLGAQAAYAPITTKALQRGLEEAVRVLGNEPGRRALFLIGDGGDQRDGYNPRHELERLAAASIEVYALGASPRDPAPADRHRLDMIGKLGAHRFANQKEQVPQLAEFLANEINSVYAVEFPEIQPGDRQMLPMDGMEHEVVIKAGIEESVSTTVRMAGPFACIPGAVVRCMCPGVGGKAPAVGPPCAEPDSKLPGWLFAVVGLALALATVIGGVVVVWRRRDDSLEDDAEVEPAPALPAPAMPAPVMPVIIEARKTRVVQTLKEDDPEAYPLVAWIVALGGSKAFQTFRLSERTVIGAGPGCDVLLDDPLVSGVHAEIYFLEGAFVLQDRGARNGIVFCDKKITRHTLVDNDQFTLGDTAFKFKWTE